MARVRLRLPEPVFRAFLLISFLLLSVTAAPANADEAQDSRTVDNIVIYLGVLPAEMIRGHPLQHPESSMHGGRPAGESEYHVVVALFDAKTGARVANAQVSARVSEIGFAGEEKELAPMEIAGTQTYGNYFPMQGNGPFRISLTIRVPGEARDIKATFEHRHK